MAKPNVVTKQQLVDSAKQCIQENGLEQLTLKAVAERAGVTQGTVYYHFKTKEQLMLDIVQSLCDDSWKTARQINPNEDKQTAAAQILEGARARCTHDSIYHTLFFSLTVHSLRNEPMRARLREMLEVENSYLASILERMFPTSDVNADTIKYRAIMMNALIDGLALQALLNPDFPADEVYNELKTLAARQLNSNSL